MAKKYVLTNQINNLPFGGDDILKIEKKNNNNNIY